MRRLLVGLPLVFSLSVARAEGPTATAKPHQKVENRSLKDVIDLALREGTDNQLPEDFAKLLFGVPTVATRRLRYKADVAPDKRGHNFSVVVSRKDDGTLEPTGLYVTVLKGQDKHGARYVKGYDFRATLDGSLEAAYFVDGKRDEVDPVAQDITSGKTRKAFENELDFHRKTAPQQGLKFVQ